ncbi:MAG: RNA polymerase subunit sigma-24, partial [Lachnospiraceae bacterium]|nr:RNA polymerase subunit sigma-24 [Lachnospiraceae bacterium]
ITAPMEPESTVLEEVKKLPLNYRISIYLYYYEGYGVKEIATLLGKKESAVSKYLSRGRAKLKSALSDFDEKAIRTGE